MTALRARHPEATQSFIYVLERDGWAVLYASDTGPFYDEAWAVLERLATHFSPAAGTPPHEEKETAAFLVRCGVEPAYDGLDIDLAAASAART